ncbi:hypothetical protein PCE1_003977 [Barthelona sp. PCE]
MDFLKQFATGEIEDLSSYTFVFCYDPKYLHDSIFKDVLARFGLDCPDFSCPIQNFEANLFTNTSTDSINIRLYFVQYEFLNVVLKSHIDVSFLCFMMRMDEIEAFEDYCIFLKNLLISSSTDMLLWIHDIDGSIAYQLKLNSFANDFHIEDYFTYYLRYHCFFTQIGILRGDVSLLFAYIFERVLKLEQEKKTICISTDLKTFFIPPFFETEDTLSLLPNREEFADALVPVSPFELLDLDVKQEEKRSFLEHDRWLSDLDNRISSVSQMKSTSKKSIGKRTRKEKKNASLYFQELLQKK